MSITNTDVTLNGTLTDNQGTTLNGTLTFVLSGYGSTVPKISGTQLLPGLSFTATVTNGVFSTSFYSNQIITPGPLVTFYNVSFQQSTTGTRQIFNFTNNYQFGPGTFDISQLTPLNAVLANTSLPNTVIPHTFAAGTGTYLTGLSSDGNFTSANAANLVDNQHPNTAVTGSGGAQTIMTVTLLGKTMPPGKGIKTNFLYRHGTGSASVAYTLSFGGSQIGSWSSTSSNTVHVSATILNNPSVTNAQVCIFHPVTDGTSIIAGTASTNTSIDTTIQQIITFNFNVANTDQVTRISTWTEFLG